MVKIFVDEREIEAEKDAILLQVCLENDIYIPNLCHIDGAGRPSSSCRLCFVEIEGHREPVPSCTAFVKEGMSVKTDTSQVRSLQKAALKLLLSAHEVDCGHCPANKKCELQRIAKFLKVGLKAKRLDSLYKEPSAADGNPFLEYYPNRCVLCGRCVHWCRSINSKPLLTFAGRGFHTVVSFYGWEDYKDIPCRDCVACVDACPVGAILVRDVPAYNMD